MEEHKRWEVQKRQWEQELAEERRAKALQQSRKDLLDIVAAWSHASNLERFFEDLARRASELDDWEEKEALLKRLERAPHTTFS